VSDLKPDFYKNMVQIQMYHYWYCIYY